MIALYCAVVQSTMAVDISPAVLSVSQLDSFLLNLKKTYNMQDVIKIDGMNYRFNNSTGFSFLVKCEKGLKTYK